MIPDGAMVVVHQWRNTVALIPRATEWTAIPRKKDSWWQRPWTADNFGIHGTQYIVEYDRQVYLVRRLSLGQVWIEYQSPPLDSVEAAERVAAMREVMT